MKKTVIFMGSKPIGYKSLEFLIKNKNQFEIEIVGVLSNDNQRFDDSLSIKSLAENSKITFIEHLDDILLYPKVDFIISVQYHQILKEIHINQAKGIAINLHMAPLPEYRGCNQFSYAIYNKEIEFGTTIHRLESGVDNGSIIAEKRFPIDSNLLVSELYDKCFNASIELFKDKIVDIFAYKYTLIPQNEIPDKTSRIYLRKDINKLKVIDLNESAEEITKRVRATAMPGFEPPYAIYSGIKYYIIPESVYKLNKK